MATQAIDLGVCIAYGVTATGAACSGVYLYEQGRLDAFAQRAHIGVTIMMLFAAYCACIWTATHHPATGEIECVAVGTVTGALIAPVVIRNWMRRRKPPTQFHTTRTRS